MVPVYIYRKHLFEQALETAIKVNQCSKVLCTALWRMQFIILQSTYIVVIL